LPSIPPGQTLLSELTSQAEECLAFLGELAALDAPDCFLLIDAPELALGDKPPLAPDRAEYAALGYLFSEAQAAGPASTAIRVKKKYSADNRGTAEHITG
jgi:hypothetical protein